MPEPTVAAVVGKTPVYVADSATSFDRRHAQGVFVSGSHGGRTATLFALAAGARGALFNDAGIGKEDAGIGGLRVASRVHVAAATVDYRSARIGRGDETYYCGKISFRNAEAAAAGVQVGMDAADAAMRLATLEPSARAPNVASPRDRAAIVIHDAAPRIVCVDSASQIDDAFASTIVATGSHGGIVDGRAIRATVVAALFNDAGVGKAYAGIGRLELLDRRGIAAGTVDCWTARIGDGRDTYQSGVMSHVNEAARALGWNAGMRVREAFATLIAARGHAHDAEPHA